MKKIIIITFLLVFSHSFTYSQYMSVFGESETQWTVKSSNLHGITTDTLTAENDTIIDDVTYRIISSSDPHHTIYLHEDLEEGRWSYFTDAEPTERLLMDLSLNVGDTIYVEGAWLAEPGYYQVDSVYDKDERKHVQVNLPLHYADDEKLTFIEGVGPNTGLSYQEPTTGRMNPYLLCYWKDDIQEFFNIYYDGECSISSFSHIDEPDQPSISFNIIPNPVVQNYFELSFNKPFSGDIVLTDISGKVLFRKATTESLFKKTIYIPDFRQSGIFILRVRNKRGITLSQKMTIIRKH